MDDTTATEARERAGYMTKRKLPKSKYKTNGTAGRRYDGTTMQNKLDWTTTRAGICERGMEWSGVEWWMREYGVGSRAGGVSERGE